MFAGAQVYAILTHVVPSRQGIGHFVLRHSSMPPCRADFASQNPLGPHERLHVSRVEIRLRAAANSDKPARSRTPPTPDSARIGTIRMLGVTWLDCRDGEEWTPQRGVGADKVLAVDQPPHHTGSPRLHLLGPHRISASVTKHHCQAR
jgi:hypothetical protein